MRKSWVSILLLGFSLLFVSGCETEVKNPKSVIEGTWALHEIYYDFDAEKVAITDDQIYELIEKRRARKEDNDYEYEPSQSEEYSSLFSKQLKVSKEGWSMKNLSSEYLTEEHDEILDGRDNTIVLRDFHLYDDDDEDYTWNEHEELSNYSDSVYTIKLLDEDTFIGQMMFRYNYGEDDPTFHTKNAYIGKRISSTEYEEIVDHEAVDPNNSMLKRWNTLADEAIKDRSLVNKALSYFGNPVSFKGEEEIEDLTDDEIKTYFGDYGI